MAESWKRAGEVATRRGPDARARLARDGAASPILAAIGFLLAASATLSS